MPIVNQGTLDKEKQWDKQLLKILQVRQVEIVDLETLEAKSHAKERYNESAAAITEKVDSEKVSRLEGALNKLDRDRNAINATAKWLKAYGKKHTEALEADTDLKQKYDSACQKIAAAKEADKQGRHADASLLFEQYLEIGFAPADDPGPAIPEPAERQLAPEAITKALQREDLSKLIAENDTWGAFDIDKALSTDPVSESDAKVLWNVLEAAIKEDEADAQWAEYQEGVKHAMGRDKDARLLRQIKDGQRRLEALIQQQRKLEPTRELSDDQANMRKLLADAETEYHGDRLDKVKRLLALFQQFQFAKDQGIDYSQPKDADERVYKEIILGAGASAAYYIAQNESKLDIDGTLMIGKVQPWAGERGKDGNINHPYNMIDPEHAVDEIDETEGLAKRSVFSDRVSLVVGRLNNVEAKITKVIKCPGDYYEVQTNKGAFYGQKITNALGIGNHKVPPNQLIDAAKDKFQDMDTFKRTLDGGAGFKRKFRGVTDVAIIGPNAAIDVATTIIRENRNIAEEDGKIRMHWFVGIGRKPFFLDGTDNELVQEEYPQEFSEQTGKGVKGPMTVYQWDFVRATGCTNVKVVYGKRGDRRQNPVVPEEVEDDLEVQLAVYAIGPDTRAMKQLFVDETQGENLDQPAKLEPVYDVDQHFNLNLDKEVQDPDRLIENLGLSPERDEDYEELCGLLKDPNLKDASKLLVQLPPAIGVQASRGADDKSSMEFVGAAAMRMAQNDKLSYDYISQIIDDKKREAQGAAQEEIERCQTILNEVKALPRNKDKNDDEKLEDIRTYIGVVESLSDDPAVKMVSGMLLEFLNMHIRKGKFNSRGAEMTGAPMGTVTASLPDNVVVNDQLTSSRAQVEARYNEMPTDPESLPLVAKRGGVNLITSDQTVIATHIYLCFPNIPPGLADYLTAQIINSRTSWGKDHEKRPLPAQQAEVDEDAGEKLHDLRQQKAFQVEWIRRLDKFNQKFA